MADRHDIVSFIEHKEYDHKEWIYVQSPTKEERYVLGKRGKNPIICFGINPSTASPEDLDKTMQTVIAVTKKRNYDGYIMLNIYPQRAKKPSQLDNADYPKCKEIIEENLRQIEKVFCDNKGGAIWAAWGSSINVRPYFWDECLCEIVKLAKNYRMRWVTIGGHGNRHPHHPLYNRIKDGEDFREIDINYYLEHGELKKEDCL